MAGKDKVYVQQKHIDSAMPESSSRCMIAEAIKDQFPDAQRLHVDLQTIRMTDRTTGERLAYLTPSKAQVALVEFDSGIPVQPFSFYLRQPVHIRPSSGGRGRRSHLSAGGVRINAQGRRSRTDDIDLTQIGGREPPILRNVTRRRFGIRGLRVNQQLQVVSRDDNEE